MFSRTKQHDAASSGKSPKVFDKRFVTDVLRAVLIAVIVSLLGVLALALGVKYGNATERVIAPVSEVIKILSILIGAILGIKTKESGALKGLFIGLFYALVSVFVFLILSPTLSGASFHWTDFATGAAAGLISGIIAVNLRKHK